MLCFAQNALKLGGRQGVVLILQSRFTEIRGKTRSNRRSKHAVFASQRLTVQGINDKVRRFVFALRALFTCPRYVRQRELDRIVTEVAIQQCACARTCIRQMVGVVQIQNHTAVENARIVAFRRRTLEVIRIHFFGNRIEAHYCRMKIPVTKRSTAQLRVVFRTRQRTAVVRRFGIVVVLTVARIAVTDTRTVVYAHVPVSNSCIWNSFHPRRTALQIQGEALVRIRIRQGDGNFTHFFSVVAIPPVAAAIIDVCNVLCVDTEIHFKQARQRIIEGNRSIFRIVPVCICGEMDTRLVLREFAHLFAARNVVGGSQAIQRHNVSSVFRDVFRFREVGCAKRRARTRQRNCGENGKDRFFELFIHYNSPFDKWRVLPAKKRTPTQANSLHYYLLKLTGC